MSCTAWALRQAAMLLYVLLPLCVPVMAAVAAALAYVAAAAAEAAALMLLERRREAAHDARCRARQLRGTVPDPRADAGRDEALGHDAHRTVAQVARPQWDACPQGSAQCRIVIGLGPALTPVAAAFAQSPLRLLALG